MNDLESMDDQQNEVVDNVEVDATQVCIMLQLGNYLMQFCVDLIFFQSLNMKLFKYLQALDEICLSDCNEDYVDNEGVNGGEDRTVEPNVPVGLNFAEDTAINGVEDLGKVDLRTSVHKSL